MSGPPDILKYNDYASYLREVFQERKSRDPKFSHRYIGLKLGIRSTGWFADVLAGRKKLQPRHVTPLAALLRLEPRDRDFFRVLVALEHAASPEDLLAAREAWFAIKGVDRKIVARDQMRYFEQWYYPVLREIMGLSPAKTDHAALARAVRPSLRPVQVRESTALLERLSLAGPRSNGLGAALLMDTSVSPPAWKKIMRAYARLGMRAIDAVPRTERDISALTLTLPPEGLERAAEEVALLRQRLLALSASYKEDGRVVYQCLFQVFPVSNPVGGTHV